MSVWALRGVSPDRVWQGVASGLLGPSSFQGGLRTAALGITIHFFIALTAATVYVTASRFLPLLRERAVPCGLAFGLMVWAFMRFVVIPLSAMRRSNAPILQWELLGSPLHPRLRRGPPHRPQRTEVPRPELNRHLPRQPDSTRARHASGGDRGGGCQVRGGILLALLVVGWTAAPRRRRGWSRPTLASISRATSNSAGRARRSRRLFRRPAGVRV